MKRVLYFSLAIIFGMMTADVFATASAQAQEGSQAQRGGQAEAGQQTKANRPTPVALKDGVATISPENTKVSFVGTHVGDEPKPRLGGFKKFTGALKVNEDGSSIDSLTLEFETNSLWTELGGDLTNHLMNADFLDVEKYPTAKFVSTKVTAGETEGSLDVVGDFTLMDKTNEITIPVKWKKDEAGVLVKGDFKLDRAIFGMTEKLEQVSKEVSISLSVGEKTAASSAAAGNGRGEGGRGGRGGFDPAAMFKNQDADGDGKLTGDEIPDRMKDRLEAIDTDGDEAISLEEMQKAMQNRGGRGQGGRGQRGGGNR